MEIPFEDLEPQYDRWQMILESFGNKTMHYVRACVRFASGSMTDIVLMKLLRVNK